MTSGLPQPPIHGGIHLPPHVALDRYFRAQIRNYDTVDDGLAEQIEDWKKNYTGQSRGKTRLSTLAGQFRELIEDNGAFALWQTERAAKRYLAYRRQVGVTSYFLKPVTVGNISEDATSHHCEDAVNLLTLSARFKKKDSFFGIGNTGLFLTRHALERTYERTEIPEGKFRDLIETDINDLIIGIAVSEAADLWIESDVNRVSAVPFSNGLMLLNTRIVYCGADHPGLGWHNSLPSGKFQSPFVNTGIVLDHLCSDRLNAVVGTFTLTYLNTLDLRDDQLNYYYAFQQLKEALGEKVGHALAVMSFAPNLAHEDLGRYPLNDLYAEKVRKLNGLLRSGWLNADKPQFEAFIMHFDL